MTANQAGRARVESEFARAVRTGLSKQGQKVLPSSYFYDEIGSALFDAITLLPEYGLTRADARIIQAHAGDIAGRMRPRLVVAELGSGNGSKTRRILEALAARSGTRPAYYPIDISSAALERCRQELSPIARVTPLERDYLEGLREVRALRRRGQQLLVLFLGSTIGNFERPAAEAFLQNVRNVLAPGDGLLLGTDLEKEIDRMLLAYDDPTGVTAAFNLNLLARINRELGAEIDLRTFVHEARYNRRERRMEMHLRSTAEQTIHVAGVDVGFEQDETIWTEACHKFRAEEVRQMGAGAGFRCDAQWLDREWAFAESLLLAA